MSNKKVILISREYGSGGRAIGEKLAKDLGIPFYDREIILRSCKESGFDISLFEKTEQQTQHPISYFLSMFSSSISPNDLSLNDQVFLIQSEVIREAAKESCVIIGRFADYILRDQPDILRVFVHAPLQDRMVRIKEDYHDDDGDTKSKVYHIDKNRATYYNYYTNKKWGHLANYDITLDSSKFGIEGCIEIIKKRYQQ